ncbi:MAG: type II toxin-antitoxin system death-on-curing family toxin [Candidatus Levyibacteriota bacterium]
MTRIQKISVADVEYVAFQLAKALMEWDEPIPDFDTRFPEKLEGAINAPFQTFDRKSLYKGLLGKSAALFYLMIKDHPFQNGNKRIAIATLLYFLQSNGYWLSVTNDLLYEFAKSIAGSNPTLKDSELKRIEDFLNVSLVVQRQ